MAGAFVIAAFFFPGCRPVETPKSEGSSSIRLIKLENGLAYAPGSATPYTGHVVYFTSAGTRQTVETWAAGQSHGPWTRYWSNGQPKSEDTHQQGSIIHRRQWYEDGTLKMDAEMKDGVGFGKIRMWWPDGRLRRSVLLGVDLQPHGNSLEYAQDGTIIADAIFHHGKYISGKVRDVTVASSGTAPAD